VAERSVIFLSQESPHEPDSLFTTDEITAGAQDIIGEDCSIAAEDNPGPGRKPADDLGHPAKFVECGYNEVDTDIVVMPGPDFTNEFFLGRVVKNDRRFLDVFCDVIKAPAANDLAIAENTLASGDLGVKQFGRNGIPFSFSAERAAHRCQ
jgi:hypothetical protein